MKATLLVWHNPHSKFPGWNFSIDTDGYYVGSYTDYKHRRSARRAALRIMTKLGLEEER